MAKASDNIFPKLIESMQTTNPAAPSDSSWKVFAKADGIYARSSNAVVGPFASASGSSGLVQVSRVILTSGDLTTTSSSFTDATGITTTITTGAHRCIIDVTFSAKNAGAGEVTYFDIAIDGTRVGQTGGLLILSDAQIKPVTLHYLSDVLSAASHTFKVQWKVSGANAGTIWAGTTNTPAILTVIETGLTT